MVSLYFIYNNIQHVRCTFSLLSDFRAAVCIINVTSCSEQNGYNKNGYIYIYIYIYIWVKDDIGNKKNYISDILKKTLKNF